MIVLVEKFEGIPRNVERILLLLSRKEKIKKGIITFQINPKIFPFLLTRLETRRNYYYIVNSNPCIPIIRITKGFRKAENSVERKRNTRIRSGYMEINSESVLSLQLERRPDRSFGAPFTVFPPECEIEARAVAAAPLKDGRGSR